MSSAFMPNTSRLHDRQILLGAYLCILPAGPLIVAGDRWLSHAVLTWQTPIALMLLKPGTHIGDWMLLSGFLLLAAVVGYLLRRPRPLAVGLCGLSALYLSGLFTQLLKHTLCRTRPLLLEAGTFDPPLCFQDGVDSFPSGHTTHAFAVATILAAAYPGGAQFFYGLAVLVALSRVGLGVHYPSDVLVGAALGLLWGALCRSQLHRLLLAWNPPLARS